MIRILIIIYHVQNEEYYYLTTGKATILNFVNP